MKKLILFSSAVLFFSGCNNSVTKESSKNDVTDTTKVNVSMIDTTKLQKGAVFYQCPMDKEVISDKAGSCSKCGMDLEKMEKK